MVDKELTWKNIKVNPKAPQFDKTLADCTTRPAFVMTLMDANICLDRDMTLEARVFSQRALELAHELANTGIDPLQAWKDHVEKVTSGKI